MGNAKKYHGTLGTIQNKLLKDVGLAKCNAKSLQHNYSFSFEKIKLVFKQNVISKKVQNINIDAGKVLLK